MIALYDIVNALSVSNSFWNLAATTLFLLLPATFVAVAGTLPVKEYRPGMHVAKDGEVSGDGKLILFDASLTPRY